MKRENYFKGNYTEIKDELSSTNWEEELTNKNLDDAWRNLAESIKKSCDKNIPISKDSPSQKKRPYVSKSAVRALRQKTLEMEDLQNEEIEQRFRSLQNSQK